MTDEAKNAEAELAKVLQEALSTWMTRGNAIIAARALIAAGYARRNDVLEEAAELVFDYEENGIDHWIGPRIAEAIRSLKGQP